MILQLANGSHLAGERPLVERGAKTLHTSCLVLSDCHHCSQTYEKRPLIGSVTCNHKRTHTLHKHICDTRIFNKTNRFNKLQQKSEWASNAIRHTGSYKYMQG